MDDPCAQPARAYGRLLSSGESGSAGALPLVEAGQSSSPAVADIIGARRARAAASLLGIDALEVDGGRAEVGVPELALNDVQRHALARELERVRVAQLMGRKRRLTPALAATARNSRRTDAPDHGLPRVGPSMMQNSGPGGARRGR